MPRVKKTEQETPKQKTVKAKSPVTARKAQVSLKAAVATEQTKKTASKTKTAVKAQVLDMAGKVVDQMQLPSEIFGAKINPVLMAQAIRVFQANKRAGSASTKSRGEVEGSTRKIYRQKGTGRARHGGIRAPLFVGGGIAFGPKPRDFSLKLSKKMRRKALFSALSVKMQENAIKIVAGVGKITPKTKEAAKMFAHFAPEGQKKERILFVTSNASENVLRATRNLPFVSLLPYQQVNTYDVISSRTIILMQEAIAQMAEHFLKGDTKDARS